MTIQEISQKIGELEKSMAELRKMAEREDLLDGMSAGDAETIRAAVVEKEADGTKTQSIVVSGSAEVITVPAAISGFISVRKGNKNYKIAYYA